MSENEWDAENAVCVYKADIKSRPSWDDFGRTSFELLEAFRPNLDGYERVVIKPNITTGGQAESGIITHPGFVGGIIDYLMDRLKVDGDRITIAEGAAGTPQRIERWRPGGYVDLAQRKRVRTVVTEHDEMVMVPLPQGRVFKQMGIARAFKEEGVYVINVPKMKTHNLAITTLSMKNLMGTIMPLDERHLCRRKVPTDVGKDLPQEFDYEERFANKICDLSLALRPNLNIIEGVVGRDGTGFRRGMNYQTNLAVAGANPVCVDAVVSYLMGFNPGPINYLRVASDRGLGTVDVAQIKVYHVVDGEIAPCDDLDRYAVDPPFRAIRYYEKRLWHSDVS